MAINKFPKIISKLRIVYSLSVAGVFSIFENIFAAGTKVINPPSASLPTSVNIDTMLGKIRDYLFGIVIVACVFMVLWGAFDIATAGDNEEKVKSAKKRIFYAAIGLVVGALSMAIVSVLLGVIF